LLLKEKGVSLFTFNLEDNEENISKIANIYRGKLDFRYTIFTYPPLFIAEACSLAALYGKCPGVKVCNRKTLLIENDQKDKFKLLHTDCRSTLIPETPINNTKSNSLITENNIKILHIDLLSHSLNNDNIKNILPNIIN
jgi:hypothetical protein